MAALSIWFYFHSAYLAMLGRKLPDVGLPALACIGIGFALLNAGLEEFYFRGALYAHLESVAGSGSAVILQAAAFASIGLDSLLRKRVGGK